MDTITAISQKLNVKPENINAVLTLKKEGCTIPFMSKYRQEKIGITNETLIRKIIQVDEQLTELNAKKKESLKALTEQGELSEEAKKNIQKAITLTELEDLVLAYQPRSTSPTLTLFRSALKPLIEKILTNQLSEEPLESQAQTLVGDNTPAKTPEKILDGLRTIVKEEFLRQPTIRPEIRRLLREETHIKITAGEQKNADKSKYRELINTAKPVRNIPANTFLTIQAGVRQKYLSATFETNDEKVLDNLFKKYAATSDPGSQFLLQGIISDAYHNTLKKQAETVLLKQLWESAEEDVFDGYKHTLQSLILQASYGNKPLVVIHPALDKTMFAALDAQGRLQEHCVIPFEKDSLPTQSAELISAFFDKHQPTLVILRANEHAQQTYVSLKKQLAHVPVTTLESGVSDICAQAKETEKEFSDDTLRKTVTLGRYVQNPLSELVKPDPLTLPLGAHQKTVNKDRLKNEIRFLFESFINKIGLDLNHAHDSELEYISGLNSSLAKKIVKHRTEKGQFQSRDQLMDIEGITPKHFFLCAGFVFISEATNCLDRTAIHPERYELAQNMAASLNKTFEELFATPDEFRNLDFKSFEQGDVGLETLRHIINEFRAPYKDSRSTFEVFEPDPGINNLNDLKTDMIIKGRVVSLSSFGAFIDLGVGQNALLHKSAMTDSHSSTPTPTVKLGRVLTFQVTEVDLEKKRIQVSFPKPARRPEQHESQDRRQFRDRQSRPQEVRHHEGNKNFQKGRFDKRQDRKKGPPKNQFGTLGDQFANLFKS